MYSNTILEFTKEDKELYEKAILEYGIKYCIKNDFFISGNEMLHSHTVNEKNKDKRLKDFWEIYYRLKYTGK